MNPLWLYIPAAILGAGLIMALIGVFNKDYVYKPLDPSIYEARAAAEGYAHRVLVMLDVFLNTLLFSGLRSYTPFQTMSSHFQLAMDKGSTFGKWMVGWLDLIQANHGEHAEIGDFERAEESERLESKPMSIPDEK